MLPSATRRLAGLLLLAAPIAAPLAAFAIDYAKVSPPAPVTDGQVSLGERAVSLPAGHWTYAAYAKGQVNSANTGMTTATHTGYFADVRDGVFRIGFTLQLPENTISTSAWAIDPCRDSANVYKSSFDGSINLPECLLVNRRAIYLEAPANAFTASIKAWFEAGKIAFAVPVYDVYYLRYSGSGHGLVRVLAPVAAFADEQAAIEWAKAIPPRFKAFFERRETAASLPALP